MSHERECKLPIAERAPYAEKLRALGAADHGDVLERNWVLDTPDQQHRRAGTLLRLRQGPDSRLTYKGPYLTDSAFQYREELELAIDDRKTLHQILLRLGFEVAWYYEKQRHAWTYSGMEIALDELPAIGSWLEVEAETDTAIDETLARLGLCRQDHVPSSYLDLFSAHCKKTGAMPGDMRF